MPAEPFSELSQIVKARPDIERSTVCRPEHGIGILTLTLAQSTPIHF